MPVREFHDLAADRSRWIGNGFRFAAVMNIGGVLLFSLAFTNARLSALDPAVFSRFGLVCIVLWGLAYLAASEVYPQVPGIVAVFALEKLVYVIAWLGWMRVHAPELPRLFGTDPLTATFYAIYGPNDLVFGLFFAYVAARNRRR